MPNPELLRIVDGIARDKNIEREQVYSDVEQAIASALRKQFNTEDTSEFQVTLDRVSGDIGVARQGEVIPLSALGRIAAQTAKQVMIQLIRQDERGSIYEEFKDRVGTIVTGTIARFEGGTMIVNLGRAEGIMPKSEQIPGEQHQQGERIQALILEVRDTPAAVKIIMSRSHPELIRRLFEREVPEVGERTIEIKALAREPGHRTKIAVSSIDTKVDAVGACVGVRGSRIKNIVDELGGEKIDIVRWNESSQILIQNALKPAEVAEVSLCFELGRATVVVNEDQLSLAIGKRGQNVRLAARLTGWDIDILTPVEFQTNVERLERTLKSIEGFPPEMMDKVLALGLIDVRDIEEVGEGPLMEELALPEEVAQRVVERAGVEAKLVQAETERKKAEAARAMHMAPMQQSQASPQAGGTAEGVPDLASLMGLKGVDGVAGQPAPPRAIREGDGGGDGQEAAGAGVDAAGGEEDRTEGEGEGRLPGAMESAEGGAPEVIVHKETMLASDRDSLSPEEEAIHMENEEGRAEEEKREVIREEPDVAALAEGRAEPPPPSALQEETR